MDLLAENGMNLFGFTADWADLEPSPGQFELQEKFKNPLALLVPRYPHLEAVVLVLKMIDTNWLPVPDDLGGRPFDDEEMIGRFLALVDALAAEPESRRLTHVLLGNEVDGYLAHNPQQVPAFDEFLQRAISRIHDKMPGVKVSTIFTYQGAVAHPDIFARLQEATDFVCYTYYPIRQDDPQSPWQMRPLDEVPPDLNTMTRLAGDKQFAFTEIGYGASPLNGSSEQLQAGFVGEIFKTLEPSHREGKIAFLLYHALHDYPPGFCVPYAEAQGVPAEAICAFMENLGLRRYDDDTARPAWAEFVTGVTGWLER